MEWVVVYLLFCVLAASTASRKNRSGIGYFLLALIVSPLIALIIVACLRPLPRPQARPASPPRRSAPPPVRVRKRDPRWQNLRAGVELETAVAAAALASVNAMRRKRENRQAIVVTVLLLGTIAGLIALVANAVTI